MFLETELSYATVNLKPVYEGHVLVIPKRPIQTILNLSLEEMCDLFNTAQNICNQFETQFCRDRYVVAIQDGPLSGQSVSHVHLHLMPAPRKPDNKFIQGAEAAGEDETVNKDSFRTEEDIETEAIRYRSLFYT